MRIDLFTKSVLSVIAVLLAMIVFKQYANPNAAVQAQGGFGSLQFASSCVKCFFDTRTGEIWEYGGNGDLYSFTHKYRLTSPGQTLVREK